MWVSEQIACQQISAHHRLFCPVNPWAMSKSEGTTLQQLAGKTKTGLRLTSAKAIFMKVLLELTVILVVAYRVCVWMDQVNATTGTSHFV